MRFAEEANAQVGTKPELVMRLVAGIVKAAASLYHNLLHGQMTGHAMLDVDRLRVAHSDDRVDLDQDVEFVGRSDQAAHAMIAAEAGHHVHFF